MHPFDFEETFGDDYLHFADEYLSEDRSNAEVAEIVDLLGLTAGDRVLDAPCGHGRIANRLATGGIDVVGVDTSSSFLVLARHDASGRGAGARYVRGDLRRLPVTGTFDAVICWFTSFGYFDDTENKRVLAELHRVLRPGGSVLVDTLHHDGFVRHFTAAPDATITEVGPDLQIDRTWFDPTSGRVETARTVVRDGFVRRSHHFVRLPTVPEWRAWLSEAGFGAMSFTEPGGGAPTLDSWRLVVRATA